MIVDVVGGKEGGVWHGGAFGDKRLGEARASNLLWYRQGLIEFHQHIKSYLTAMETAKKDLKAMEKNKQVNFTTPMLDSDYSGDGKPSFGSYSIDDGGIQ